MQDDLISSKHYMKQQKPVLELTKLKKIYRNQPEITQTM